MGERAKSIRPAPARALRREALFSRLDAARGARAVWVEGPPGSGKTTLLATYLRARRARGLWLTLDAEDADPATFLDGLAQAARQLAPPVELPRFGPEYGAGLAAFFRHVFHRLADEARPRLLLVLDDCHLVPDASPLFGLLAEALAELGGRARVFFLGRRPPPPALPGLVHLDGPALRLSAGEVAALAGLHGVTEPGRVAALVASVDGWAAGVVLQLAMARDWAGPPGDLPASPQTFDYLASQVLDRLDPDTRRVLLEVAVLPWVDARAAEAALGVAGALAVLAELARRGSFVTALEGGQPRYRLHPLLHALLRTRAAAQLPAERLRALRLGGAAWLEAAGEGTEGLALLRDAGAWPELAALVARCGQRLLEAGRSRALAGWLAALPGEVVAGAPGLRYLRGLATFGEDARSAQADLLAALDAFAAAGDAAGAYLAWAAWAEAVLYATAIEGLGGCLDRLEALRARLPMPPDPDLHARVVGTAMHALGFRRPGDPRLTEWLRPAEALAATEPRTRLLAGAALVNWQVNGFGDLAAARAILDDTAPLADGSDPAAVVIWRSAEAVYRYFAGDAEGVQASARQALALSAATGARLWDGLLLAELAWGATLGGRLAVAQQALDRLAALDEARRPMVAGWLHLGRFNLAVARGDRRLAAAEAGAARAAFARVECEVMEASALVYQATAAALQDGAAGEGPGLEAALAAARAITGRYAEQLALLGLAARELRAGGPALEGWLSEAFALARRCGYRIAPTLTREEQAALCAAALARGIEPATARAWVLANRLPPPPGLADASAWPRELQVRLLGGLEVAVRGEPLAPEQEGRPLEVLAALAAHGAHPVAADALAAELWPDAEGDAAAHALETALYRLRGVLGARDLVRQHRRRLSLDPGRCWVDLWELERRLGAVEREALAPAAGWTPERRRAEARALEALVRGPLLPGLELPRIVERRRHLERRVARALEQLR